MIINKENNIDKARALMGINESVSNAKESNIIAHQDGLDGKTYGLVKENNQFYIKETNTCESGLVTEAEFEYVGGLVNKGDKRYFYKSLTEGVKNLNLFVMAINERLGKDIEGDDEDDYQVFDDEEIENSEDDFDGEETEVESEEEVETTDGEADDDEPTEDEIDHYVGKLTASIRDADDLTPAKIKSVLNSVIASLPMGELDDQEREKISKRIITGKKVEEGESNTFQEYTHSINENYYGSDYQMSTPQKCYFILDNIKEGRKEVAKKTFDSLKNPNFFFDFLAELDFNDTMVNGHREYFDSEGAIEGAIEGDSEETIGVDVDKLSVSDEPMGDVPVDTDVVDDEEVIDEDLEGTVSASEPMDDEVLFTFIKKIIDGKGKISTLDSTENGGMVINGSTFSLHEGGKLHITDKGGNSQVLNLSDRGVKVFQEFNS